MDIIEQIHKHNVNVVNNMFLHDSLMQDMMNDKVVRDEMNSVISRLLEGILQQNFVQTKHKCFLSAKFGLYWRLSNTACMGCLRKVGLCIGTCLKLVLIEWLFLGKRMKNVVMMLS